MLSREQRPAGALDPLFRTAALCCAPSVGAVLTGTLGDGAACLPSLKFGGITVVQEPGDGLSGMTTAALPCSQPHHVSRLAGTPALFEKLVRQPAGQAAAKRFRYRDVTAPTLAVGAASLRPCSRAT